MTQPPSSPDENTPAAAAVRLAVSALRAKLRLVFVFMALAVAAFVIAAADAGRPAWLVALIGFFGVILIAMFIALAWFWLHVFRAMGRRNTSDARD